MQPLDSEHGLYDVAIVGGAAAGLTAALYTSRQGLKTIVLTKDIGGQALLTPHIENYPGFESIGGLELMEKFKEQAVQFGTEFVYEEVKEIETIENWFKLKTPLNEYRATSVVLAFGKTPKDLGVPGEEGLVGKGVSYCAVCDGPLFKDRVVGVVGWGNSALEAAIMLCNIAKKVYLVFRSGQVIGHGALMQECVESGSVEPVPRSLVVEVRGEPVLHSVVLKDVKTDETRELELDGLFVEMGYMAKTEFVKDLVDLSDTEEIIVAKDCSTSHVGIFAAGDVTDTPYKQAVISAGQGATAGLSAYHYVQNLRGKPAAKADW
ncbi:MAG: NAD(P)/FAD-dependent oxidoreductase, partial [Candidatus Geothermarchaeales archaeon]